MALYVCKKMGKKVTREQSTKSETFANKTIVKNVLLVIVKLHYNTFYIEYQHSLDSISRKIRGHDFVI
jgi:anaerobic ribonucleoside-triphosphate reductase